MKNWYKVIAVFTHTVDGVGEASRTQVIESHGDKIPVSGGG